MKRNKAIALALVLLMLPLSSLAAPMLPTDDPINRRIERNTAKTLDNMPEEARARTDTLVIGVNDLIGETNPFWVETVGDTYVTSLLYDELLFADNNGTVGAGVASYTTSVDGLTYTFTINDSVRYADGTQVTSQDFINALYLLLMPGYDGSYDITRAGILGVEEYLNGDADSIIGISSANDRSFSITTLTGNPGNLIHFAIPALRFSLFGEMKRPEGLETPEDYLAFYDQQIASVRSVDASQMAYGQYTLSSVESGNKAVLAKNDAYWRGRPTIGTVEVQAVPVGGELDAIMAGTVDIISLMGSVDAVDIAADFNTGFINLYTWEGDVFGFLGMDLESTIFSDINVRKALAVGIDRDSMRRQTVERYGVVPNMLLFDSFDKSTSTLLGEQYAYDAEQAAALLDEAGWTLGEDGIRHKGEEALAFTLTYNTPNPIMDWIVSRMEASYAELGIDLTVEAIPFEALLQRLDEGSLEMYFMARRLPQSPALAADLFAGDSFLNLSGFESDLAERLLTMADSATDEERQTVLYEMLFQEIYLELPIIPLYRRSEFLLANARVMNVTITTAHDFTSDVYRFFLTDTLEGQW